MPVCQSHVRMYARPPFHQGCLKVLGIESLYRLSIPSPSREGRFRAQWQPCFVCETMYVPMYAHTDVLQSRMYYEYDSYALTEHFDLALTLSSAALLVDI